MTELFAVAIDDPLFTDEAVAEIADGAPPERRERVARVGSDAEKRRLILADATVRYLAATKAGADPLAIRYAFGVKGKPSFKDAVGWKRESRFNVSHSGRWVLVAFGDVESGVDIERIGRGSADLARRVLHGAEASRVVGAHGGRALIAANRGAFTCFWTLKESFIKYTGLGMSIPLASFYFVLPDNAVSDACGGANAEVSPLFCACPECFDALSRFGVVLANNLTFHVARFERDYMAAICCEGELDPRIKRPQARDIVLTLTGAPNKSSILDKSIAEGL